MKPSTKLAAGIAVIFLAAGALASQYITVRQRGVTHNTYTTNAGELTRDVLVGQTFVAEHDDLSAIAIMFATYSGRNNTLPVHWHLRSSIDEMDDVRSGRVWPSQLGDNQFYRFDFDPIADSKGRTYFFFVVSPDGRPGNAVTVDLDTRDPYHRGSAYLVRGQGSDITNPAVLARSGKPTVDVVFQTYYTVPLRVAVVDSVVAAARNFVATWNERRGQYWLWLRVALPAAFFMVALALVRPRTYKVLTDKVGERRLVIISLLIMLLAAIGYRWSYASALPITNDEGNYLYDAWRLGRGTLAGGDGYVKAPAVIAWVAVWQWLFGNTIMAGRLASVVIGALTIYPIYSLAKTMWGARYGLVAAAAWAFVGAAVVFDVYVHTQPLAIFFGISGLAVLYSALRGTAPRLLFLATRQAPSNSGWFVLSGMLLGLGVASRKSILALGLLPLMLILLEGRVWRLRWQHLLSVGIGFAIIITAALGLAYWQYGSQGIWEAIGVNSAEDGITAVDQDQIEQVREYSLRGMTPFFRESLPLILLSVLGFGFAGEKLIRGIWSRLRQKPPRLWLLMIDHVLPKAGWLVSAGVFWWAWRFFSEYEGAAFMFYGIPLLWYGMAGVIVLATILTRPAGERVVLAEEKPVVEKSTQPDWRLPLPLGIQPTIAAEPSIARQLSAWLFVPLWFIGLVIFYTNWIKFHANYIAEFIPPLVLLAALGAPELYYRLETSALFNREYPFVELGRRLLVLLASIILFWALFVSNYITYVFEHTGTFQLDSIQEAAAWAKEHIPPDQPIFTGAAVVPYLSGHRVSLDIAHPRWYAYEFTRTDPKRLGTFLPSVEEMVQAYRDAQWFLLEKQTAFSFLMEYAEIESGLPRDWQPVHEVENGSNTLTFYRRVR